MKTFRYVLYGKIKLTLDSVLHIGGSDNTSFKMAVDSNGKYILPSSGIAGAVGHAVRKMVPEAAEFLGDTDHDSKVYFYDAVCENAGIERRVGISIDDRYGTVGSGALINMDYVSPGMRTEICMQGFASTEEELDIIKDIFKAAGTGLASGNILLGAKKASGSGRFAVRDRRQEKPCGQSLLLDLTKAEDRRQFLKGVQACFDACKDLTVFPELPERAWDTYVLEAETPYGILVAGGNPEDTADRVNMYRLIHEGNEKEYYIPGSTLKGLIRSYAYMAAAETGIDKAVLEQIFGSAGKGLDENGNMTGSQSRLFVRDCLIRNPGKTIHNRIRIDRWLGSALEGAKMDTEVLYTKEEPLRLEVYISGELEESVRNTANALVYLALRDMGAGLLPVGSNGSIGRGRLKGRSLWINGTECTFEGMKIQLGEKESFVRQCLEKLGGKRG
jgi:CRISPR/Cas system CSM-associated protein Csm3 (group 7 of RAMP superfamily)